MKMQKTHKHLRFNRYGLGVLAVFVVAAATFSVLFIIKPGSTEAATPKKAPIGAAVPSQFAFSGVSGWWQGATNKTSIAIFPDAHDCFVSVQHITGSLVTKQAKDQATLTALANQGHTVTQLGAQTMNIQTDNGVKQYQLLQQNVDNPSGASSADGTQLEGGQESAYLSLSSGDFLYLEGYCDTSAELATTLPVLEAVSFDVNKVK